MNDVLPAPVPAWRRFAGFAFDPGAAIRGELAQEPLAVAFIVPATAFGLFFLQSGLDRVRVGTANGMQLAELVVAGLVLGTVGIALTGVLGWAAIRMLGGKAQLGEVQRAFAMAYRPTLIATLLGLGFSLALGWHTAIAFGVTGVLWALGPISGAVRQMLNGRLWPALTVSTLCGLAVLWCWAWLEVLI